MENKKTITLPVSGDVVEFIPFVTGGILLDIDKQPDISKYLITSMVKSVVKSGETEPAKNTYEAVRAMHGRDWKVIDVYLQGMIKEATDPETAKK
jgi:hypothetical protein